MNAFSLDGELSTDYGIIMTAPPAEVSAERESEVISIPGRNGDIIMDSGRYKNVPISYDCAVIPADNEPYRPTAIRMAAFLRSTAGYRRLENTYDPDHFRLARISTSISVESIADQAGTFQIPFDCKPQRFLKSGETPVRLSSPCVIVNETLFPAQPLITVYGSGSGTLSVGGKTVKINAITDQLTLDCEAMNAYRQPGEGAPENKNGDIFAPEFPVLSKGSNTISWTGGITSVKITPRWWTL